MTGPTTPESSADRGPRWGLAKDLAVAALIAVLVVAGMQWSQRESQRGGGGSLTVGSPAPEFALTRMHDGARVGLGELEGKPVVLNFWATWCGACISELPDLQRLQRELGGSFHLVTLTDEPPSVVRPFLARRALDLPVLHDVGGRVAQRYRVTRLPSTVIIDADGRVVHDFVGVASVDILRGHIERLQGPTSVGVEAASKR